MKLYSYNKMPFYTREKKTSLICWNEQTKTMQLEDENQTEVTEYTYDFVRVRFPFTYETLVSDIVKSEYSSDKMEAVINNYLLNPENVEHKAEFDNMQQWREQAKIIAKQALTSAFNN